MARKYNEIPREWLDAEVTISREELGRIMAREINDVVEAAEIAKGPEWAKFIKGLFDIFAASVGTEVFKKLEEEERER